MVTGQPWEWPETVWQQQVGRVRAGRSLRPDRWPHGRRAAVALSFDSDHETIPLRDGEFSPCQLSQGEYGSRVAVPKILNLLATHGIPATFFVPAVSALLHPADIDAYVQGGHEVALHGWIHERNTALPPGVERELAFRAADTLERLSGTRPVGLRTPSWDFSEDTLAVIRELGLRYDSSLMADDDHPLGVHAPPRIRAANPKSARPRPCFARLLDFSRSATRRAPPHKPMRASKNPARARQGPKGAEPAPPEAAPMSLCGSRHTLALPTGV
ncbi:polysaccharide deacetylase family protein [Kutzneria chonburiensis]|uniref:Polysaccharide deacetylase family protein n=1 Tax=Kutzneria chonburiensis TaxID=1483604 RepID=A0ABV6MJ00_9PSEU|nr:polysaccharide deacetylase family protein [Kutzneria chonburiensis]